MNSAEFLEKVTQLIEVAEPEKVTLTTPLEEVKEWDSLAVMTFLNFCDENFSDSPDVDDLFACKTFEDVYNLVSAS